MNIAMVVYSHYSRDARVRRYTEGLARMRIKVDIICLKENYNPRDKNISLIQYPFSRRRFGKLWYIAEYLLFFVFSTVILSILFLKKSYRIFHIHNMPDFLLFAALIPKIFAAKVILDMHDPMPELYMSKYHVSVNSLIVRLLKFQEKLCFTFADEIITANEEFKKIFLHRYPNLDDKISVILNCPDPYIFKPTIYQFPTTNHKLFTLMYMGTVEKRFGLDIAIEAMPNLIENIPTLRFIIIPKLEEEGEYIKNLKLEIKNLKLEKYIHFLSPLPLEKIAEELRKVDIGIVLAKNGVFTQSIFPVKLLEFIQMGIPVVATRTKVLSEYFDDKMIYFLKRNTEEEFTEAVFNLWRYKKLRINLAINAKKYFKKYNWKKEEEKYLKLISTLFH